VDAGFFRALSGLERIEGLDDRGADELGFVGLVRNKIQTHAVEYRHG
jgi:hypothetical protein